MEELTAYIDSLITQSFEKFVVQIKNDYTEMAQLLRKKLEEKEIAGSLALEKIAPELHVVNTLIRDFEDVRRLLL
jgi:predicted house-cleaning noncanonical NTP pyrophosphatase (MazG superfamily)